MPLPTRPSSTRRKLLAAFPCGLFLAPARAATQDAWAILRQTEAKYRAAWAYDVQVMSAGSMEVGMLGSRWGARLAAVAPDHFLAEIPVMGPYRIDPRAAVHKWLIVGDRAEGAEGAEGVGPKGSGRRVAVGTVIWTEPQK